MELKQIDRKIRFLMTQYRVISREEYKAIKEYFNPNIGVYIDRIHAFFNKHNINDIEMNRIWFTIYHDYVIKQKEYQRKPIRIRKDNKTVRNYGTVKTKIRYPRRNDNLRDSIRYPKRCRKTAWKRFYRLFPELKKEAEK